MSDNEESFIVLGSTPTPSMEQYLESGSSLEQTQSKKMTESTTTQINSGNFSLIQAGESLKPKFDSPKCSISQQEASNGSFRGANPLAASIIMGETKSSLLQAFPSLMQSSSSMPIDEVQALQHLLNEHGQMKDSLHKANVAMRKNFTNIQKWQDEVKTKYAEQVRTIDEQRAALDGLEAENKTLKQALQLAETRATDQAKKFQEERIALQKWLDESRQQVEAERLNATAELDELRKAVSEKQSILQNMAKQIERLELEKQEFVVVRATKAGGNDVGADADYITKEEHQRQLKVLQREMSVVVARNLEFDDMKNVFVDEINCLKVNLSAAEELHAKHRTELARQARDIETKDVSLAENIRELKTLAEQVDVLTAQLDIYKVDFEAERTARAELASEKDRILADLKLLQKRNQQLIEEVQNGRVAQENATKAANEALDKRVPEPPTETPGPSRVGANPPQPDPEEQEFVPSILHCPLCNNAYRDLTTLQNHVEDCVGVE
ncbi:NFkappaB essential modulator [Culex quinquefasciatus]|uniref:NFkappaB essential modulator n=1 Tax=Culex quinquefasciatus TaxID=7176 RepID=B0WII8_CULQU|nr:NFkappaB essential modulator [Culex quinquefasciatus]|eukprot:XP_001848522.1 NFkappaB essential modulator [Culex quinquefasciatus]